MKPRESQPTTIQRQFTGRNLMASVISSLNPFRDAGKIKLPLVFMSLMLAMSILNAADLDRTTALSKLRSTGLQPYTVEMPIGNEVNLKILLPTLIRQDPNWGRQLNSAYKCLNDLGYLRVAKNPSYPLEVYIVATTDKSDAIGKVLNKPLLGYAKRYVFQIADRLPERVSGIKMTGTDSATVIFEWKLGNPNDVYKCMVRKDDNTLITGVAEFGKYDDGWRVEKIDLFKKLNH